MPRRILEWRQLAKLKSTYADALVEEIKPATGRVHTNFQLAATSTGRLSSTDPNVQNIPIRTEEGRKIRRAFVAEAGHLLLSADYSQIELRLAADMAGIDALKEAFRQGIDIHALTASEVFGVPVAGMDPSTRRRAKAINFGIIYGISAFGLAAQLSVPQSEASAYIKAYFERFPGIRAYMDKTKLECREKGYVETLFGRKCYIPGIRDANVARRQFAERQAINAPLQGTAADIIKRAMIRLPGALAGAGLAARMLLQVHDELLFEVPADEAERTAALVKDVMEAAPAPRATLSVPLVVETGWASNWDEAHQGRFRSIRSGYDFRVNTRKIQERGGGRCAECYLSVQHAIAEDATRVQLLIILSDRLVSTSPVGFPHCRVLAVRSVTEYNRSV